LWAAMEINREDGAEGGTELAFANAQFPVECLAFGLNGYSAG